MDTTAASIAAWTQTLEAIIALGDNLTDEQWRAPTECPEWTVKDVVSHVIGGERWMADGHPAPTEGLAAIAGRPVSQRRDIPPDRVLAELREVFALRREQLATSPPDPEQPTMTAYGAPVTLGILLGHRAFDTWVHEQDIRRAVGAPGNLDAPGARFAYLTLTAALPRVVAKLAGAPSGSSVRLDITGPVAFSDLIAVDDARRAHLRPAAPDDGTETVRLRMDWETFARLAAGRIPPDAATVTITGDAELGRRILDHFAVTP